MNVILFIIGIILAFSTVVVLEKIFKQSGLYLWIAIASVLANIFVCKNISMFGISFTLGNIMFASTFLATDILNEKYGLKSSKQGVYLGLAAVIIYLVSTQFVLQFIPDTSDIVHPAMEQLFALAPRVCIASLIMYFIANLLDVHLYDWIKRKFPKHIWIRNNIATIISQILENFLFVFGAFYGVYDLTTVIEIALTTSLIEVLIALCDTPFLYISHKLK